MSRRNGDRARFQKDRKRKLRRRQRTKALLAAGRRAAISRAGASAPSNPSTDGER